MVLVERLIKALKSVTLYQCLAALAESRATLAVARIQSRPSLPVITSRWQRDHSKKNACGLNRYYWQRMAGIYMQAAVPHEDFWIEALALAHEKIKTRSTSTNGIDTQSRKWNVGHRANDLNATIILKLKSFLKWLSPDWGLARFDSLAVCCDFRDCWPHEGKVSSGGWQRRSVSFLLSPGVNLQEGGQWELEWPCRGKHWRWIRYFGLPRKCLLSHQAHKYRQRTKRWAKSPMWSKDDRWARGGESTKTKASSKVPLYWVSRLVREGKRHGLHPWANSYSPVDWSLTSVTCPFHAWSYKFIENSGLGRKNFLFRKETRKIICLVINKVIGQILVLGFILCDELVTFQGASASCSKCII